MIKIFGMEHLLFLFAYFAISIAILVIAKLKIKSNKVELIYFRTLSIIIIVADLLCRIGEGMQYGFINGLPSSICSVTGFILPIIVLFGKKNLSVYQGLVYIGIFGGVFALILATYISQGTTIFQLNTFMSLIYHGFILMLCVSMILFGWFKPDLKRSYYFPLIFSLYIAFGAFEIFVIGILDAMSMRYPLIDNTPFTCWFILPVGTVLVYLTAFIYEFSLKLLNRKKGKNNV